jgi:flavin-binding protein dodecin
MTVEKFVDLTATGPTMEEAVAAAVQRAGLTLRGITRFEVSRIEGTVENATRSQTMTAGSLWSIAASLMRDRRPGRSRMR